MDSHKQLGPILKGVLLMLTVWLQWQEDAVPLSGHRSMKYKSSFMVYQCHLKLHAHPWPNLSGCDYLCLEQSTFSSREAGGDNCSGIMGNRSRHLKCFVLWWQALLRY